MTGLVPSIATSFAMSCTAMIEGVDTDFCKGSLAGSRFKPSASLFATILLKSFCKGKMYKQLLGLLSKPLTYSSNIHLCVMFPLA